MNGHVSLTFDRISLGIKCEAIDIRGHKLLAASLIQITKSQNDEYRGKIQEKKKGEEKLFVQKRKA